MPCEIVLLCGSVADQSPSRKSLSRNSKGVANAADFAEPLTLSALSLIETRRKIAAS